MNADSAFTAFSAAQPASPASSLGQRSSLCHKPSTCSHRYQRSIESFLWSVNIGTTLPGYDPQRERAWHLSVWLAPDTQAWCVHDVQTGSCVALQASRAAELPQQQLLPLKPVSVSFTALPEISTLVPESALAPGTEPMHLKRVHGALPEGLLRDEPIPALSARCVYLHDEAAEQRLIGRFPSARALPLQAILVNGVMARSSQGPTVLLHRSATRLDLAIAREQQLLLSNTYHATTAEDTLYYTLFALEQCCVDKNITLIHTCGTHLGTEEEALLADYIPDVRPATTEETPPAATLGLPAPHAFTALLEQFACAS